MYTLKQLKQANCIRVENLLEDEKNFYIVTDLARCNMIEAIELLKENKQRFTEKDVARFIKQILIGIDKLNKLDIIHRNI